MNVNRPFQQLQQALHFQVTVLRFADLPQSTHLLDRFCLHATGHPDMLLLMRPEELDAYRFVPLKSQLYRSGYRQLLETFLSESLGHCGRKQVV